jgi:putative Holliday junction resolvase
MPFIKPENLAAIKIQQKAILGIDYGTKKIGLALSDRSWLIASPFKVIPNNKFTNVAIEIFKIVDEEKIDLIVIGLPINLDGSTSKMQQAAMQFGRNLIKIKDINIYFYDERYTSKKADELMLSADLSRQKRAEKIDKIAATIMLQNFLEFLVF